ncbi:MAG: hypothetical protein KJ821_01025 [Actinobacteria bacterium]|nr:hypothetical protein [Actinomycetota bacterium]
MSFKFTLYIPKDCKDSESVKKTWEVLRKIGSLYNIKINKQIINKEKEWELKSQILWFLAVYKRIKIKQTRKAKSLYPQLVIFAGNKPFSFYPQSYGKDEITIEQFLEGLLKGNVCCLHDKEELEKHLSQSRRETEI